MEVPPTDEPSQQAEVAEHIPWAELGVPPQKERSWVAYVVAGAIAVASLGALGARSISTAPESASTTVAVTGAAPVVTTLPPSPPESEPLTEADLLAIAPGRGEMTAAARAAWFVTDYFSTGGDPGSDQQVVDALPASSQMPTVPQPDLSSYVDWAATSRIEAIGHGQFSSTVLFRLLAGDGDAGYVRLPVQAVEVVVEVDATGGSRVVDLPMPAALPAGPASPPWAEPIGEVPEPIRAAALRIAADWGAEPSFLEGSQRPGGWRVVVGAVDQAGIRWPLTLWLTEQGDPLWPPAD